MKKGKVTIQEMDKYFITYGFVVQKDCERLSEDRVRNYFELIHSENDTVYDVVAECTTDNINEAYDYFYPKAKGYIEENNIQPIHVEIDIDTDSDEYIVYGLSLFLRDETLEECPINIVSREVVDGEDAQLVHFVFGECEETCVAVVYNDGTIYTPQDWQTPVWDDDEWEIEDSEWMDCNFRPCINFNGMPRRLI